jgi:hypothetical protein
MYVSSFNCANIALGLSFLSLLGVGETEWYSYMKPEYVEVQLLHYCYNPISYHTMHVPSLMQVDATLPNLPIKLFSV